MFDYNCSVILIRLLSDLDWDWILIAVKPTVIPEGPLFITLPDIGLEVCIENCRGHPFSCSLMRPWQPGTGESGHYGPGCPHPECLTTPHLSLQFSIYQ